MSLLNENIDIRIKEVRLMSWDASKISVSARRYHALALRLFGTASFSGGGVSASTRAGDVFYMPAGYTYNAEYPEQNEILVIHFESSLSARPENYEPPSGSVRLLFERIYNIWEKKDRGYYFAALSVFGEILDTLSRAEAEQFPGTAAESFENALGYMEKNYLLPEFTIEKMISASALSGTYFRTLFFERFGTTPVKYLRQKRLSYADGLLSSGRYTVTEVAEKSGFSDVKYFARACKKEFGIPPSRLYRHKK